MAVLVHPGGQRLFSWEEQDQRGLCLRSLPHKVNWEIGAQPL